jgi:hypothetical protein
LAERARSRWLRHVTVQLQHLLSNAKMNGAKKIRMHKVRELKNVSMIHKKEKGGIAS